MPTKAEKTPRLKWQYEATAQKVIVAPKVAEYYPKANDFQFVLTRYKDSASHEESLDILCLYQGNDNGLIHTSIDNIDKDMPKFRRYGVVLSPIQMADLKKTIESNYLDLVIVVQSHNTAISAELLTQIVDVLKEDIAAQGYLPKDKKYNIPVVEFNALFDDDVFSAYSIGEIKSHLVSSGYIDSKSGRTTMLLKIDGKPVRVISLYAKKLGLPETVKPAATDVKA